MELQSLEQLIGPLLQRNSKKYLGYTCKNLLSTGENYGSVMLDVKIKLESEEGEEIVSCVAKTCPPSELLWKMFNTKVTFKKEMALYKDIIPTLNDFGRSKGIDNLLAFFAKCIGARISTNPESIDVDKNAVLLLENLKLKGFRTADRFTGCNSEETKLILRDLAVFHVAPLAFKLLKPDEFAKIIRPHLNRDFVFNPNEKMVDNIIQLFKSAASHNEDCVPLLPKMEDNLRRLFSEYIDNPPKPREPLATMVHNDFWINNTMLRYEDNKPMENRIVDFQVLEYNSPTQDLIFFLYTSVELQTLQKNFDYFIEFYFETFSETLMRLGCDMKEFTFKKFVEEMGTVANETQFGHCMVMLTPIFTKKGQAKELSDIQNDDDIMVKEENFHQNFYERLHFILLDFEKRGWL